MHLLFISHCFPWPLDSGAHLRRFHLIAQLAKRHTVTLATMLPPTERATERPTPLDAMCKQVLSFDSPSLIPDEVRRNFHAFAPPLRRIWNLLRWPLSNEAGVWTHAVVVDFLRSLRETVSPDVVWVDRSYIAEAAKAAGFSDITVDVDDLLTGLKWRDLKYSGWYTSKPLSYLECVKTAWYERSLPSRFQRVVVCKEEDARFFRHQQGNVFVVPNGTAANEACDDQHEQSGEMLFVGALFYQPNQDAVRFFVREVMPTIAHERSDARLTVIGRDPPEGLFTENDNRFTRLACNVSDLRPYYAEASLAICPLRMGAGTKLKVLEALAYGKAVVATTHAVGGLGLKPGLHCEVADSPRELARACIGLLGDPKRRRELGRAGRQYVLSRFTWDKIGELADRAIATSRASS